jgi:hypothetical protein
MTISSTKRDVSKIAVAVLAVVVLGATAAAFSQAAHALPPVKEDSKDISIWCVTAINNNPAAPSTREQCIAGRASSGSSNGDVKQGCEDMLDEVNQMEAEQSISYHVDDKHCWKKK